MKLIPSALAAAALLVGTLGSAHAHLVFSDTMEAGSSADALAGLLDSAPTASNGERLSTASNDIIAFEVIGPDINIAAVPEPMTYALYGLGLAAVGFMRRRRMNRD